LKSKINGLNHEKTITYSKKFAEADLSKLATQRPISLQDKKGISWGGCKLAARGHMAG
jgi:hypothetical protein